MSSSFAKDDDQCFSSKTNKSLGIDEACLSIINSYDFPFSLFSRYDNCNDCEDVPWKNISGKSNTTLVVPTRYPLHMNFTIFGNASSENNNTCQSMTYDFIEHGHYGWNLSLNHECSPVYEIIKPNNPYLPIVAALMIFTIASLTYGTTSSIINAVKKMMALRSGANGDNNTTSLIEEQVSNQSDSSSSSDQIHQQQDLSVDNNPVSIEQQHISHQTLALSSMRITKSSTRIQSIDAFRGVAILLMIFVNNGGGKYVIFNHSPWYGITIADLVLPCFLFVMGLTIVLSQRSQLRLSIPRSRIIYKGIRRSLMLVILGLVINSASSTKHGTRLEDLRLPGVLELLGVTYLISLIIETCFGMKTLRNFQHRRFPFLQDIIDAWAQWLIIIIITGVHLSITFLLNIPGCPKGYFGPGGYENHGKYSNCTAGAAGYIDRIVFTPHHMYSKVNNTIYGETAPHDPEGLMNTISALVIVQFGIHAGRILFCYYLHNISKILRWLICSIVLGTIGMILCGGFSGFFSNTGIIPISKNMMTLSFVFITCSLAFILFAIFYYLIDHRRVWNGGPFIYAGRNSIFLYMAHYLTMNCFPWSWKIYNPTHSTLLAMNLWTTILWALITYGMSKKDIIITV